MAPPPILIFHDGIQRGSNPAPSLTSCSLSFPPFLGLGLRIIGCLLRHPQSSRGPSPLRAPQYFHLLQPILFLIIRGLGLTKSRWEIHPSLAQGAKENGKSFQVCRGQSRNHLHGPSISALNRESVSGGPRYGAPYNCIRLGPVLWGRSKPQQAYKSNCLSVGRGGGRASQKEVPSATSGCLML